MYFNSMKNSKRAVKYLPNDINIFNIVVDVLPLKCWQKICTQ